MTNYCRGRIIKTFKGFEQDCDLMRLVWDKNGCYLGQWQDDMLEGDGMVFIPPDPTGECFIPNLNKNQMDDAEQTNVQT